jgi:hypothetical protein
MTKHTILSYKKKYVRRWQILLVPFFIGACFNIFSVLHYGVNTPLWDEWESVPLFQKADAHTLDFSDLWAQRNEHRILFPNIVILISAYATHWNIKVELLISFILSAITALMLYLFVLFKIKRQSIAIVASILIAAWFFSPVPTENWLLGIQIIWFMCITGLMVSVFLIDNFCTTEHTNRRLLFGASILSAVVASYSMADGLLIWPIGLLILSVYRQSKKPIITWVVGAMITIGLFYYHYVSPSDTSPKSLALQHKVDFLKYIFSYLGSSVSKNLNQAILCGLVLSVILIPLTYLVWCQKERIQKFVPWLSIILLALMSAIITGLGRLNMGVAQSTTSRYTIFSLLYIIGITGLILTLLDIAGFKQNTMIGVLLSLLVISLPFTINSYVIGVGDLQRQSNYMKYVKSCTHKPSPSNGCLLLTAPYPQRNTEQTAYRLSYLKYKHWAGY